MSAPLIEGRGLGKAFGASDVLRGVDVELRASEVTALLGPSGSGKSTLVRLLHLLEAPTRGIVLVEGSPVEEGSRAWLASVRRMGLVQQKPGLLRMTALDNVAFPLRARGASRERARDAARAWLNEMGLARRAAAPAHDLSGGEAQRVGLARALATRPDALLLDEATNQLDPESARLVEAILAREAQRGAAILLVTHSVAQAKRLAARVVFLVEGRVAERGPSTILDAPASRELARFVEFA